MIFTIYLHGWNVRYSDIVHTFLGEELLYSPFEGLTRQSMFCHFVAFQKEFACTPWGPRGLMCLPVSYDTPKVYLPVPKDRLPVLKALGKTQPAKRDMHCTLDVSTVNSNYRMHSWHASVYLILYKQAFSFQIALMLATLYRCKPLLCSSIH